MILFQSVNASSFRQITRDVHPSLAAIDGFDNVRLEVTSLMIVDCHVYGIGIVHVSFDIVDVSVFRNVKISKRAYGAPVFTTVFGDLEHSIVGANINQSLDQG